MNELEKFRKSNQARKLKLALNAGFKTIETYLAYLKNKNINYDEFKKLDRSKKLRIAVEQGYSTISGYMSYLRNVNSKVVTVNIKKAKKINITSGNILPDNTEIKTINTVIILDQSGSMQGSKYKNAIEGINDEIAELRKSNNTNINIGIVGFSAYNEIDTLYLKPLKSFSLNLNPRFNVTALNDAVYITLNKLMNLIKPGEKTVVKIFTDGQENDSRHYNADNVKDIIKKAEKNDITVTFIGTTQDTEVIINKYNIRTNNAFAYQNNAEGVKHAFKTMRASTTSYVTNVVNNVSNEELLDNFFVKKTGKL